MFDVHFLPYIITHGRRGAGQQRERQMSKVHTLNAAGQHQVAQFIGNKAKDGAKAEAWFAEAETAADDAFERGLTATIEISTQMSWDGVPHILTLDEQWFDVTEAQDE
jgi:hypothetical protein